MTAVIVDGFTSSKYQFRNRLQELSATDCINGYFDTQLAENSANCCKGHRTISAPAMSPWLVVLIYQL
jgi:hypothetical protein